MCECAVSVYACGCVYVWSRKAWHILRVITFSSISFFSRFHLVPPFRFFLWRYSCECCRLIATNIEGWMLCTHTILIMGVCASPAWWFVAINNAHSCALPTTQTGAQKNAPRSITQGDTRTHTRAMKISNNVAYPTDLMTLHWNVNK